MDLFRRLCWLLKPIVEKILIGVQELYVELSYQRFESQFE